MKIVTTNSKIKRKCKTMLAVIRNLILDFILYFFTAYMRKYPAHVTSVQGRAQNTLYITWRSKQKVFYDKESHKKNSKLLEVKMIESSQCKYKPICYMHEKHGIIWTLFKKKANFFLLKLLFVKIRCLINVNKICGPLRNGWKTTKWVIYGGSSLNIWCFFRKVTLKISISPP